MKISSLIIEAKNNNEEASAKLYTLIMDSISEKEIASFFLNPQQIEESCQKAFQEFLNHPKKNKALDLINMIKKELSSKSKKMFYQNQDHYIDTILQSQMKESEDQLDIEAILRGLFEIFTFLQINDLNTYFQFFNDQNQLTNYLNRYLGNYDLTNSQKMTFILEKSDFRLLLEAYLLHLGYDYVVTDNTIDLPDEESSHFFTSDSMVLYKREIAAYHLLSAEEEKNLATLATSGDLEAQKKLVAHNLRYSLSIAAKLYTHHRLSLKLDLMDLVQEGNIGLMKAVERFDPTLGFRFSTYATWWIKQSIYRAISNSNNTIRIPIHLRDFSAKVNRYIIAFEGLNGIEPSIKEIASYFNCAPEKVEQCLTQPTEPVSYDGGLMRRDSKMGEESPLLDVIPDDNVNIESDVLDDISNSTTLAHLKRILSEREYYIISARFGLETGEEQTLEQVGQTLGVTRERIRQLENKVLRRLKGIPYFSHLHFVHPQDKVASTTSTTLRKEKATVTTRKEKSRENLPILKKQKAPVVVAPIIHTKDEVSGFPKQASSLEELLTPIEFQVFTRKFGGSTNDACSVESLAQELKLSVPEVRQIEKSSLQKVRTHPDCERFLSELLAQKEKEQENVSLQQPKISDEKEDLPMSTSKTETTSTRGSTLKKNLYETIPFDVPPEKIDDVIASLSEKDREYIQLKFADGFDKPTTDTSKFLANKYFAVRKKIIELLQSDASLKLSQETLGTEIVPEAPVAVEPKVEASEVPVVECEDSLEAEDDFISSFTTPPEISSPYAEQLLQIELLGLEAEEFDVAPSDSNCIEPVTEPESSVALEDISEDTTTDEFDFDEDVEALYPFTASGDDNTIIAPETERSEEQTTPVESLANPTTPQTDLIPSDTETTKPFPLVSQEDATFPIQDDLMEAVSLTPFDRTLVYLALGVVKGKSFTIQEMAELFSEDENTIAEQTIRSLEFVRDSLVKRINHTIDNAKPFVKQLGVVRNISNKKEEN